MCVCFCFTVDIAIFRVSVVLPCSHITPISIDTFESADIASLRKLVRHSGVQVCIAITGNVKENVTFDVFCRKQLLM